METNIIAQISTALSAQRTNAQLEVAAVKLSNDNIEAEGKAALQLIQSVPQPQGNVGNNINVKV
jgi:hypothetical protein